MNLDWAPSAFAGFVLVITAAQLCLFGTAAFALHRVRRRDRHLVWRRVLGSPLSPTVSVIVPAYNEALTIVDTVRGLLAMLYPNLEIVVVNDGSTDGTLDELVRAFDLASVHPVYRRVIETERVRQIHRSSSEPRLVVVTKVNGASKADAMNAGLNVASGDLVCAIDADTLVAPDALQRLVAPFLADERTVAVGGTVRLTNGSGMRSGRIVRPRVPRHWLAGIQVVEYTRAFLVGRIGWNPLGGNLIISGAFGLFRRDQILAVGGYEHGAIGEDMELIVRMRRRGYEAGRPVRVEFTPDPVAWTQAPERLRVLAGQRNRWFRGLCDVMARHGRMIGRPRYRSAGLLALPYYLVIEGLSPFIEAIGFTVILLGLANGTIAFEQLDVLLTAYMFGAVCTLVALLFDEIAFHTYRGLRDRMLLVWFAFLEQVVYRPLTIVWRLWGFALWAQGRSEWGQMERTSFETAT